MTKLLLTFPLNAPPMKPTINLSKFHACPINQSFTLSNFCAIMYYKLVLCSGTQVMVVADWLQSSVPHVVSPGDEMEVAPGGVMFEPVVEPLVAVVKYRSFSVSVNQCDVSLLEEKELLRLVVSVTVCMHTHMRACAHTHTTYTHTLHTHTHTHTHTHSHVHLQTSICFSRFLVSGLRPVTYRTMQSTGE